MQNEAPSPADFNEMTQCSDMEAKKQELFCFSTRLLSVLYHRKLRGAPGAITGSLFPFTQ